MSVIVSGNVKNGLVVPNEPVPAEAIVESHVIDGRLEVVPESQEGFDDWERPGGGTVEMVEHLAEEMDAHEKR